MLNYEDNLNEPAQTAAQARVKTEEFAHAIASLEVRKAEELRRLEGTVVLGEAVKDLQIEVTPDEILAEVERNRSEAAQSKLAYPQNPRWSALSKRRFSWRTVASVTLAGFVTGWLSSSSHTPAITPAASLPQYAVTREVSVPVTLPAPPPAPHFPFLDLDQIKDKQAVYCNSFQLEHMQTNLNFMVSARPDQRPTFGRPCWVWPVVKHKGVLYVRGWVLGPFHADFVKTHPIVFASAPSAFDGETKPQQFPEQVTLPLAGTRWSHDDWKPESWETLQVEGAKLDSHAWEH